MEQVPNNYMLPRYSFNNANFTINTCTNTVYLHFNSVPEDNVATLRSGAAVIRGEMKASLLDGDNVNYDLDRGFTRHPIDDNNGQGIVIKLVNPYIINTIKMLLWDRDMRYCESV